MRALANAKARPIACREKVGQNRLLLLVFIRFSNKTQSRDGLHIMPPQGDVTNLNTF